MFVHSAALLCAMAGLLAMVLGGAACARETARGPATTAPATIALARAAFEANGPLDRKYTGEGEDVSPPLAWKNLPPGTKELALLCADPDAPRKDPWVHWVLAGIPADTASLAEGVSSAKGHKTAPGMLEGKTDWGSAGYQGPMPPPGKPHRYFFRLYALDARLALSGEPTKADLLKAMAGHILAVGELVGTYQRK
jgi:Raf kinase inhibitor-like YbhB/YbcL family protein